MRYYHITRQADLPSIMEQGLIVQIGANSEWIGDIAGVFLFISAEEMQKALNTWFNLLYENKDELISLIVDLPDDFPLELTNNEWEVRSAIDIPPTYLSFWKREYVSEEDIFNQNAS